MAGLLTDGTMTHEPKLHTADSCGASVLEMTPDERRFWFWQVVGIASFAAGVVLCALHALNDLH
jgi:hypothetical protein